MSGRSIQWIWAVMMIVSLTSMAMLSQEQCLQQITPFGAMCNEANIQGELIRLVTSCYQSELCLLTLSTHAKQGLL